MVKFSFSVYDLEYFLLIFIRVSCFVVSAPFFNMRNTPRRVKVGLAFFTALLLYQTLTPSEAVAYNTLLDYAIIVMKEALVGLLIGFAANICTTIVNFAGHIADMEVGLSMMTLMDPTTQLNSSITGVLYQYAVSLILIATGVYRYLFGALVDTYTLIPINGAIFDTQSLLNSMILFLSDYVIIGFRMILPIFCCILLLNAVLGILAKTAPQLNMFSVGIQLKVLTGLSILFFTAGMLPGIADFIFREMQEMIVSFMEGMI